jgi:sulfite exporter TauE/SafE
MMEALLIVAGGLLGSGHCIGMCGGFALTLGSHAPNPWRNLLHQSVYGLGRVSVYALAGAFVGFGAWRLTSWNVLNVQAVLSIVAGLFLIAEGLFSTGWVPRPFAAKGGCPGKNVFAMLLRGQKLSTVFVGGLVNGLLPCGLVYGYLALAASMGNVFHGAAVMALFGVGTLPALILIGLTGSLVTLAWRQRILYAAACCILVTGVLAVWRGGAALQWQAEPAPACPYCSESASES